MEKDNRNLEILAIVTREELQEWLLHPTTAKVLDLVERVTQSWAQDLAEGATLNLASVERTALQTTLLSARISGARLVLSLREQANEEQALEEANNGN